jgi:hypothetical protein
MKKHDWILYFLVAIVFIFFCYSFDFALNNSPLLKG